MSADENVLTMPEAQRRNVRERATTVPQSESDGGEPDDIESLIASFTEPDDAWKVSIYRFAEKGRLDSAAKREFLETLPVTDDLQEIIRDSFGGGSYSLEFKQKGRIKKKGVLSIADLPEDADDLDEPEYEPPAIQRDEETERRLDRMEGLVATVARSLEALVAREATPPVQPVQVNPMSMLKESMRTLRELQELDSDLRPPSNQPPASPYSDEDRALMSLLKDSELRNRIAGSIATLMGNGDAPEPEPWYARAVVEIAKQPALTNRALGLLERVLPGRAAATAQAAQASVAPSAMEPTQPIAQTRTAEVENVTNNKLNLADVLGSVVADLKNNVDVGNAADECVALIEADAETAATLNQLLQQTPADVLAALRLYFPPVAPMIDVPHAEEWVADLQSEIQRRHDQQAAANAIRAAMP